MASSAPCVCVCVDQVLVGEGSHPDRVKVYGPGVEKTGLKANEPTYFTVDCGQAGQGEARARAAALTLVLIKPMKRTRRRN